MWRREHPLHHSATASCADEVSGHKGNNAVSKKCTPCCSQSHRPSNELKGVILAFHPLLRDITGETCLLAPPTQFLGSTKAFGSQLKTQ